MCFSTGIVLKEKAVSRALDERLLQRQVLLVGSYIESTRRFSTVNSTLRMRILAQTLTHCPRHLYPSRVNG